ncbi:MAG: hypothetical protein ACLGIN_13355 [Candidatus Sericytochromatia bacterium]
MKDRGPNWGLAFGSGSFLIVWSLGFLSGVPIEVIALRACIATMLGAVLGIVVDQTLEGIRSLKEDLKKGSQVDFTVPASAEETVPQAPPTPESASQRVPQAPPSAAEAPGVPPPADDGFAPLDFKQAARQVQASLKD